MTKNTPKQIYITKSDSHTTYMGESLKEAQELYTKNRGSCSIFAIVGGTQVLMQTKTKDYFPDIMKEAFNNATVRL